MIQLILFLLLGCVFSVLLYLFARRSSGQADGGAEAMVEARQALNSLQDNLLPPELIQRVFAREDLLFACSIGSAKVRATFLRERKRVALRWVRELRKQVLSLRQFHAGRSRFYAQVGARTEFELALSFAYLLFVCRVLEGVFQFRGPFAAPRIVHAAIGSAESICATSERSLGFLASPAVHAELVNESSTARPA